MNSGLLGFGTAIAWGTGDYLARFSGRAIGADRVVFVVVGGSVLLLFPFAYWQGLSALLHPTALMWIGAAGISSALSMWLLFMVLARGPLAVVSPILASYPLPLLPYALAFWDFAPTPAMYAAIAATLAGVWLVARAGHKTEHKDGHALGSFGTTVALTIVAVLSFDFVVIGIREASAYAGELAVIWASRVVAFSVIALSFLFQRKTLAIPAKWWLVLLAQAILDTSGGALLFWGQSGAGTTVATVVSTAYGVITVILARLHLREVLSFWHIVGMVLVFGGAAALSALS